MKVLPWSTALTSCFRFLPWLLLALLLVSGPARAAEPIPGPRPLSAAERQAVDLAVAYLAGGPEAWLDHLHPEGPLARLDRAAALAEIGVRAGPHQGAAWRLETPGPAEPEGRAIFSIDFPSGLSGVLTVDLKRTGEAEAPAGEGAGATDGEWRIHRVRSLVDQWDKPVLLDEAALDVEGESEDDAGPEAGTAPPGTGVDRPWAAPPGLATHLASRGSVLSGLVALLALAALLLVQRRPLTAAMARRGGWAAPALALAAAGLILSCGGDETPAEGSAGGGAARSGPDMTLLGELVPLRRALTLDGDRQRVDALAADLPEEGPLRQAADLWRAELALDQSEVAEARALMEGIPAESTAPLAGLLRARLAFIEGDEMETVQAYDLAATGPDFDGQRMEAMHALGAAGFDLRAETRLDLLVDMGSRSADVYYNQARYAALRGEGDLGEEYFRQAWALRPAERSVLLSDPLLASLLARPTLFPMFELSSPAEPVSRHGEAGRGRPLELPPQTRASLSGSLFQVEMAAGDGDLRPSTLTVPGGARLAPHGTKLLAADGLRKQRQARVMSRLPELMTAARDVSALAQPRRRDEFVEAGTALAEDNRWQELETLTAGLAGGELEPVPGELVHLRAAALFHLERNREARDLLVRRAGIDLASERRDPASLYHLAELVAAEEEHELAIRLLRRASQLSPHGARSQRIRQLEMQKALADDHKVMETEHFRLVYPRLTGERYPRQLGFVLEEELKRLQRWIPYSDDGVLIEVQLYPVRQFFRAYSTTALVLGIYDGVLRVPFADLRSLDPELVSVLSHELGHALIGRATDEQAPKWFHEGLAVHVQMQQRRANPIPDLHDTERVIAFPVIEPILGGFAEGQLIDLAYSEAAWVVHYLEAEHGISSLERFLAAFRRGDTTPEAVEAVLGMTPAELDRSFRRWALEEAPRAWPSQVRRYDRELDVPFERAREEPSSERIRLGTGDRGDGQDRMKRWHLFYTQKMARFKRELGALAGDLQRGSVHQRRLACDGLAREAAELLEDRRVFNTPGSGAGNHLRRAVDQFQRSARACSRGDGRTASGHYQQAEAALGQAAAELRPYGLRP